MPNFNMSKLRIYTSGWYWSLYFALYDYFLFIWWLCFTSIIWVESSMIPHPITWIGEPNGMLTYGPLTCRSEFEAVRDHQIDMENRGFVVIFITFVSGCLAAVKLFVGVSLSFFKLHDPVKFYRTSSAWFFLLLSSSIIAFILVA